MRNKQGFTLIELLVVIAIIAILAAILFPVFAKVREKARQTTCASNLKQLGLALIQYTGDYDEALPCGPVDNLYEYGQSGWAGLIYPYVKSIDVYTCPDESGVRPDGSQIGNPWISYALNQNAAPELFALYVSPTYQQRTLANFTAPASTVHLFECIGLPCDIPNDGPGGTNMGCSKGGDGTQTNSHNSPVLHKHHDPDRGFNNWLAVDGHVKFLPIDRISLGTPGTGTAPVSVDNLGTYALTFSRD